MFLCYGIFTSCSTYACFQVKLNGGTALTPKQLLKQDKPKALLLINGIIPIQQKQPML